MAKLTGSVRITRRQYEIIAYLLHAKIADIDELGDEVCDTETFTPYGPARIARSMRTLEKRKLVERKTLEHHRSVWLPTALAEKSAEWFESR